MKKLILSLAVVCLSAVAAEAQDSTAFPVRLHTGEVLHFPTEKLPDAPTLIVVPLPDKSKRQKQEAWLDTLKTAGFAESSVVFWAGVAADYCSSIGGREGTKSLRASDGGVNALGFFVANGVIYGMTVAFNNFAPKALNWVRRLWGAGHGAVAVYNLNQPRRE